VVYNYLIWLFGISLFILILERIFGLRNQAFLRPHFFRDVYFLVFNGEIFGFVLAWLLIKSTAVAGFSFSSIEVFHPLQSLPFAAQCLIYLVLRDFIEFNIHILLHRVPFLWEYHKLHHSVTQMDCMCNFRFHFMEIVVYKTLAYVVPLLLGVPWQVLFVCAIIATTIGHLNHSNLNLDYGVLGRVFNHPRMHIWHHLKTDDPREVKNFGIVFSIWDQIYKTAYFNPKVEPDIGLCDEGELERKAFSQFAWGVCILCCLFYLLLKLGVIS